MKVAINTDIEGFPVPVLLVGTYDLEGKPNVMTAAWAGICNSEPPCVAISLRKATYTYGNVVARQAFTLSIPDDEHVQIADYVGIVSGRDIDKFAKTMLTPEASDVVDAPYVKEFPLVLECQVLHTIEIGSHTQFIGRVLSIKIEEDLLGEDGIPDPKKLKPLVVWGGYRGLGKCLGGVKTIGKTMLE